ncbi:MAG: hypothetical protein SGJ13_08265 [Actinomycetota bacterium]|nr:hypothetical protein [Actinomycetota bacterium]
MKLDPGTFLLQWATGCFLFGWVTTRHRLVSLGYGWLIRIVFGLMALGGGLLLVNGGHAAAGAFALATAAAATVALAVSVVRRGAGARGQEEVRARRKARVAAMVGSGEEEVEETGPEFPPVLDLVAAIIGFVGLLFAAEFAGGPYLLAASRLVVGAAFLGSVSDAMLLGHWYLVQPGLPREPVRELVRWVGIIWPFELLVFLWPTGMVQVFNGTVDDGYDGILGWMWAVCAVTTIGLVVMTWYALKEKSYSAVMAATGLLYLAILTAFGVDLVARAVLNP